MNKIKEIKEKELEEFRKIKYSQSMVYKDKLQNNQKQNLSCL